MVGGNSHRDIGVSPSSGLIPASQFLEFHRDRVNVPHSDVIDEHDSNAISNIY
jgi:hypothetical protein